MSLNLLNLVSMSKLKSRVIIGGVVGMVLLVGAFFVLRSGVRPLCHRAIDGAFQQWMIETGRTNGVFPNADGNGTNSLALIERYFGDDIHQYAYVPGLRSGDPVDLVLFYLRTPTHYTWHGDTEHNVFSPRRWMVVSPEIVFSGTCPEGGDLLDTPEFKRRIQKTIAFLQEHQRPHWRVVAEEQKAFLNSIKD